MSEANDSKLPDLNYVRELAEVFSEHGLGEIEIETGDQRILLRRASDETVSVVTAAPAVSQVIPAAASAAPAPAAAPAAPVDDGDYITSPFVGTFYRSPRPETPAFVKVGDQVGEGQTVCIVEAMKLFNEIEADFSCEILEVLVENQQPVEFGTKLFRVRKQ